MILRATGTKVARCPPDHLLFVNPSPADGAAVRKPIPCGRVAISWKEGYTMIVLINIALAIIFASIYSSIWRRITGVDLDFAELIAIASVYIIVSVGVGRIIHFSLLTSLFAFGIGIWGVLKVVSSAIKSQKG